MVYTIVCVCVSVCVSACACVLRVHVYKVVLVCMCSCMTVFRCMFNKCMRTKHAKVRELDTHIYVYSYTCKQTCI